MPIIAQTSEDRLWPGVVGGVPLMVEAREAAPLGAAAPLPRRGPGRALPLRRDDLSIGQAEPGGCGRNRRASGDGRSVRHRAAQGDWVDDGRKSRDARRVRRGLLGKTSARTSTPPGVSTRPISAIPAAWSVQWRIVMVANTRSNISSVKGKCSAPAWR